MYLTASVITISHFLEFCLYYFPSDPPYFLLFAGLFIGLSCGAAFDATLKRYVKAWSVDRANISLTSLDNITLKLPFVGIACGIGMFLTSGMSIFGLPDVIAGGLAIPLTLFTAIFLWLQLKGVLKELDQGGSQALDLDSWG
jgi:hypothetical protein